MFAKKSPPIGFQHLPVFTFISSALWSESPYRKLTYITTAAERTLDSHRERKFSASLEAMASGGRPSDIIQKARRKLTEALSEIDSELILDAAESHLLLIQGEYFSLSQIKNPQEFVGSLIDTILGKGGSTHERFLDCLENLRYIFPRLRAISEYVENGPLNLRNEPQTQSTVVFLENRNGAESLQAALFPEKGNEVVNLKPSGSETGKEVENPGILLGAGSRAEDPSISGVANLASPDAGNTTGKQGTVVHPDKGGRVENLEIPVSLEMGNKAESPNVPPSCRKGRGTKIQNTTGSSVKGQKAKALNVSGSKEKGSRTKIFDNSGRRSRSGPSVRREISENSNTAKKQSKATEDLARMQAMRNTPGPTSTGEGVRRRNTKEGLNSDVSLRESIKGSVDSVVTSGDETIRKKRKQLTEVLQKDLELTLDDLLSQSVITEEEYEDLDKMEEDPKKKIRKLLLLIQKKGERACCQFLECVEMAYPGSDQILQCSVHDPPSKDPEDEVEEEPEQEEKYPAKERRKALRDILNKLKLRKQKSKKLSLGEILEISSGCLKDSTPHTLGDLPWHFLRKVLALNVTARSTRFEHAVLDTQGTGITERGKGIDEIIFFTIEMDNEVSVNPLDVLCAVLLCSDSFLQQEIFSKMSMCQFALPLLLPPLETPKCTLMLWAMRDIVRKWRPHSLAESRSFREESLVMTSMHTISFVRVGSCSLSKSKLLNEFLSPSQQHHDFFIHRDMESGNIPREISDGLVEMAWYFPGGQKSLDHFPEPVAVANLRGDVESHWVQFSFLTQVSSATFIFAESISEREYALLSSLKESTQYYFILDCHGRKSNESLDFLKKLSPVLKFDSSHILVKGDRTNTAQFVELLRSTVGRIINSCPKSVNVDKMSAVAQELTIQVDEDCKECQNALKCASEITEDIKDVANYKEETLKLQGKLWKNLAKVEKELCRMECQGDTPSEKYRSELKGKWLALRKDQHECDLTIGLINFIDSIKHLKSTERHYFLKWMKFNLDQIARENLSKLRGEYKERCMAVGGNSQKITELDELISSSSLGVEHFMRELGQFYEAEYSMVKEGKISKTKRQFVSFPSIAADLMLEGFPLELIDGDASNIPLQWITDVFTKLNHKLRGQSKMMVITVLGVQSTGKSTLLNTMFGLQFAVSSGRCTRGAFMTLLNVRENMTQELGCDFILVIDTEGLKAPELAQLEDSYQHDNELATLVIGLSDITIVNMAMENATEMKDILQIVTHAFLRMEKIGQRTNCHFVHQNVSDVSAHDQNMRDRKHLLEQLNEMTRAAAKMENMDRDIKFSDIMDYDPEMNNWYIPGLWHGVPPMAPVNRGYSEKVFELKKYLFEFIKTRTVKRAPKDIPQFIEWIGSLWNAVKHENFIFSFRNSLIAEAYNQLSMNYSKWDWGFRRNMHLWVSEQETMIQNISLEEIDSTTLNCELQRNLFCGEQQVLESLKEYFESGATNLHLIEKYKEDFVRSANSLKHELESYALNKCQEAIRIKNSLYRINSLQTEYLKIIEGKVDGLLEECRKNECRLENDELKKEFERMWTKTLSEISPVSLEKRQIYPHIELYLRKELAHRGSSVNLKVQEAKFLPHYNIKNFQMKPEYIQSSFLSCIRHFFSKKEHLHIAEEFAKSLMDKCMLYIEEKINSRVDYDEAYCGELLHMINKELQQGGQKLHTAVCFEVDLKLHILGEAAHAFQNMHEKFVEENNPQVRLEKLKPQYFSTFRYLYQEKDAQQIRAQDFCIQCLHPALVDYIKKRLGIEIVDDILSSGQSIGYASRNFFQFTILKELLEDMNFNNFVTYIMSYEEFVKSWIWRQILDHYAENDHLENLEDEILSEILMKVRETLDNLKHKGVDTISEFLDSFCREMQKELVISNDSLLGIQFKNMSDPGQFSVCVKTLLPDLKKEILSAFDRLDFESKLSELPMKPMDMIFKRVFGCGKQCPFCKVPCEAGGSAHKEHFATVHRPQGLGRYRSDKTKELSCSLCSSDVVSNKRFRNGDTRYKWHPYKDYRVYYPDWCIQPDPSINASDYWKFILKEFNHDFAREYLANPADLPEDWEDITQEKALEALKETYNMN
ncbi:interferon-induced very large GTPase 1-like isoform X2 [Hemicordylus capensis]|uniref:interferon-induced very large GTPase 1-like isoform X2 n=1 Tax=Hemicordylus capensis TaxID=884348 RepID=UPI002303104A|nr:interferon-induced very large GTPase 1-like isoform X2 [Hemicordylus capensis]